jgi:hypothetical protein
MIRFRDKRFLAVATVVAAVIVFVLPAFVAFRYTAPEQRGQFLAHPWRGWSFAYAALAVPGDAKLKTSGMALRKADWLYKGTAVDPREVQLLYVEREQPYTFSHSIGGRELTSTAVPSYRHARHATGLRHRTRALRHPRRSDAGRTGTEAGGDHVSGSLAVNGRRIDRRSR